MDHTLSFKNYRLYPRMVRTYLIANPIGGVVALYAVVGLLLKLSLHINILPPCPWRKLFDIRCPGCGLTRAFIYMLQLDFTAAFHSNPLSFIVFPAIGYYIIKDFLQHVKHIV